MEISVGDYVRTNLGIGTVHRFYNDNGDCYVRFSKNVIKKWVTVIKHSKDIIDLIEVGDYVNGYKVREHSFEKGIFNYYDETGNYFRVQNNYDIKEILTHEQFEANAYVLEKER